MPRKTLALISGLVLVTVVLFVVAFKAGKQQTSVAPSPTPATAMPSVETPAHTTLALVANPTSVAPGQQGKFDVTLDTTDNNVTAVELEIQYDPTVMSNVQVQVGSMFQNPPIVLKNNNDTKTGKIIYAFGVTPNQNPVQGTGVAATITYTAARNASGKQAQITVLPTSLVTARGVADSVLKPGTLPAQATVTIGAGSAASPATNVTPQ